jgi:hypothetical protein
MSSQHDFGGEAEMKTERNEQREPAESEEQQLDQALQDFRVSVHAWSDAAYSAPRTAEVTAPRRIWRLAAGWALGCALLAGGVSGGVYEQHHRQELARIAAARAVEQQRLAAEQRAREEEELLASVDSDVSREIPSAMEPLAQLTAEDETK